MPGGTEGSFIQKTFSPGPGEKALMTDQAGRGKPMQAPTEDWLICRLSEALRQLTMLLGFIDYLASVQLSPVAQSVGLRICTQGQKPRYSWRRGCPHLAGAGPWIA